MKTTTHFDGVHLSQPELLGARMHTAYQSF
jgi:hypothetical protein